MDWSLLVCARQGHVTYAPDEAELRDLLHAPTPVGEAWRCLRCGDYVHGEPHGDGPADRAPLVKRGRELRDAFIMRSLAIERAVRVVIVWVAAYGLWRFSQHRESIQSVLQKELPILRPVAGQVGWDLDHSKVTESLRTLVALDDEALRWVSLALVAYGLVALVEAVGLWLLARWGEYFAVVATCFGLPLELYELAERITPLRLGALVINILLIVYLVWSKRLFGVRGGKAAHEAHLRTASLLEVTVATTEPRL
ncbi:DUF2127 domain-containing protein [Actinocorallia longicatena]|uniref:DUF2127 domain-containing protein n=1 Tax=Actinocorallia longicatena TaxID=111803 RepID=A0ABP6QLJ4_9ACTN